MLYYGNIIAPCSGVGWEYKICTCVGTVKTCCSTVKLIPIMGTVNRDRPKAFDMICISLIHVLLILYNIVYERQEFHSNDLCILYVLLICIVCTYPYYHLPFTHSITFGVSRYVFGSKLRCNVSIACSIV